MKLIRLIIIVFGSVISHNIIAQEGAEPASSIDRGKLLYEQNCLACHQADGSGVPHLAPPLIKGTFVGGDKTRLIKIITHGLQDVEIKGEIYANPMPAFDFLTDQEIADLLTFVRGSFENMEGPVSIEEVKQARKSP
ncbi:MAG: cytochrome c [Cyclobacteriaceae bacterium]